MDLGRKVSGKAVLNVGFENFRKLSLSSSSLFDLFFVVVSRPRNISDLWASWFMHNVIGLELVGGALTCLAFPSGRNR